MANAVMVAKLKKVQAIAKKLKKERPRLTHIEAVKLAWKQIPKTKTTKTKSKSVGSVKRKVSKITEKTIQDKVKRVKRAALNLDDAQNAHMLQKIGALMQKPFQLKHYDGGKLKSVTKFNASNLATAKKIAKKYKEHSGHKGKYLVSSY
jgi:exonuclease VII large subunit